MASQQSTVDYILEQTARAGLVEARKMFGEYGIYCDGKMVAVVCDDELFVKPTTAGRALLGDVTEKPPFEVAKPWFLIDGDRWDDAAALARLFKITAAELPVPAKKTPSKKRKA